jgi:hypothetical protein
MENNVSLRVDAVEMHAEAAVLPKGRPKKKKLTDDDGETRSRKK